MEQAKKTEYYDNPAYSNYANSWIYDHGDEGKAQVIQFPDLETLIDFGDNGAVNPESQSKGDWRWGEYRNLARTRDALTAGMPTGEHLGLYKQAKEHINNFDAAEAQTSAVKQVRRRAFGEQGDELDIDRYMSGDIQCWQSKPAARKRTSIKVFLNLSVSFGMGAETMMQNTALFAAVLGLIEAQGMSTEVLVGTIQEGGSGDYSIATNICYFTEKASYQYLDESKLVSRGAPGLFRYYFFSVIKNMHKGGPALGYGSPSEGAHPIVKKEMDRLGVDLLINGANLGSNVKFFLKKISEIQYGNE